MYDCAAITKSPTPSEGRALQLFRTKLYYLRYEFYSGKLLPYVDCHVNNYNI